MSDKPIENHRYSTKRWGGKIILVKSINKNTQRIDYKYLTILGKECIEQPEDRSVYYDDWEDENYVDITEEEVKKYIVSVQVNNSSLGIASGGGTFPPNTEIKILATPFKQCQFDRWDDGVIDNPRYIKVTRDLSFTAFFSKICPPHTYTVKVVSNNMSYGKTKGSGEFIEGTNVAISATPYSGKAFSHWHDGNKENPRTIKVGANAVYIAIFEQIKPRWTWAWIALVFALICVLSIIFWKNPNPDSDNCSKAPIIEEKMGNNDVEDPYVEENNDVRESANQKAVTEAESEVDTDSVGLAVKLLKQEHSIKNSESAANKSRVQENSNNGETVSEQIQSKKPFATNSVYNRSKASERYTREAYEVYKNYCVSGDPSERKIAINRIKKALEYNKEDSTLKAILRDLEENE